MIKWDYDVIIVGAGVAGASSAIALGQEGYQVLLLDKENLPRYKPCGEGIMPQGVSILDSLGVLSEILESGGFKVRGLRFRSQAGVWAQADFPPVEDGLSYSVVMRRYELDHLLAQRAESYPNVTVRQGFQVREALHEAGAIQGITGHPVDDRDRRETFRAPLTLGADGMRSIFHNQYGITRTMLPRKRLGVSGHLRGVEGLSDYIEVLHQDGSEIYVAPWSQGITLVAILLDERVVSSFEGNLIKGYHDFLKSAEGFGERIQDSELIPPVGARGPFGFDVEPIHLPGLLLIGDSAGFLDPITGEGMTLALKCVQAAVPIVRRAFESGDFGPDVLAQYVVERNHIIGDVYKLTQLMLDISRFKRLTNQAIKRLSRDEALFQKLMGIVTGANRYSDFTIRDRIALGLG